MKSVSAYVEGAKGGIFPLPLELDCNGPRWQCDPSDPEYVRPNVCTDNPAPHSHCVGNGTGGTNRQTQDFGICMHLTTVWDWVCHGRDDDEVCDWENPHEACEDNMCCGDAQGWWDCGGNCSDQDVRYQCEPMYYLRCGTSPAQNGNYDTGAAVRDGTRSPYNTLVAPFNRISCWNGQEWICLGDPVYPSCNISNISGLTRDSANDAANPQGTIPAYKITKGDSAAFTLTGSILTGTGQSSSYVGVDVWRIKTISPNCYYGDPSDPTCPAEYVFNYRTNTTNPPGTLPQGTLNATFDSTYIPTGDYYIMCNAYKQVTSTIKAVCSGDPYTTTWPTGTAEGTRFCGTNSRIKVKVENNVPAAYGTITITGSLLQNNGSSCPASSIPGLANDSNNKLRAVITSPAQEPCGAVNNVDSTCSVNAAANSYTCTITSHNQACAAAGKTEVSQVTVNLSAISPSLGYSAGAWTTDVPGSCTAGSQTKTFTFGPTSPTATNNIVYTLTQNWIKLKDASYGSATTPLGSQTIPNPVTRYDAIDDTADPYFIIGNAGVATGINITPNTKYSSNNFHDSSYMRTINIDPSRFFSYIKSRKEYNPIQTWDPNLANIITQSGIYYYDTGSNDIQITGTIPDGKKAVIVIGGTGKVTVNVADYNLSAGDIPTRSLAIIADNIVFSNTTNKAGGIFVANTITADGPTIPGGDLGLKISGNLVALDKLTNNRTRTNRTQPSVFVVIKPALYLDLLPYFSVTKYDWRQLQ